VRFGRTAVAQTKTSSVATVWNGCMTVMDQEILTEDSVSDLSLFIANYAHNELCVLYAKKRLTEKIMGLTVGWAPPPPPSLHFESATGVTSPAV